MDPLSVSAAIVGLLTAGASVTALLQNVKYMPKFARGVLLEVNSITSCLGQLQCFLNKTVMASRSRTSLIMIDEVRVVLTQCVTTFSELKETLDNLGMNQQRRSLDRFSVDRLKWASKEQMVSNLLFRLQGSRMSLNLMLTTLNW